MASKLADLCSFAKGKVATAALNSTTYISTENMLPNKEGIVSASSLPTIEQTQEYLPGDVLVSNIRPYFRKIWMATGAGGCSNDVLVFRAKPSCDPSFLYYLLSDNRFFDYATATSKGTKMPRGDKAAIMEYAVPNFDIETQRRIAATLSGIGEKITINRKINDNLQQQAATLFKAWFVDYEPFNGTMPSDWVFGTIDDLAKKIICGKTPSTKIAEYYGSDIPFITIPDMHGKTYAVTTERYLSKLGANSQAKKTLPKNSVCVSCIGTAGLVVLVAEESQTNQQINSIIPKEDYSAFFIYLLMQTLSDTINKFGQSGSTIVNLNKAQFGKIQVYVPSITVMAQFDEIVSPLFEKILINQKENLSLTSARNTLLPRLMSGEIDVSGVQI